MNHRKFIYSSLLIAAISGACSKMEEKPYQLINTKTFYKTPADAESAIIYAYANLPEVGYYSRGYYIVTELPTENLTQKGDAGANNVELDNIAPTNTNADLDRIWRYIYRGISRSNAVINNVPKIPGMSEAARNQIVGEGYFLRALNYFNLVRLFGEVPVRTDNVAEDSDIPLAKSPLKDIYDLIIADLIEAEKLIAQNKISEGRANKVAAQALLSKVYLHLASSKNYGSPKYDFVTSADDMYAKAKEYSGKVIFDQSAFGFTEKLVDIFSIEKYKAAGAVTEHIFDAAVDRSGDREGSFSKISSMFLPADRAMTIRYDPSDPASPMINIGQGWNHFWTEAGFYNNGFEANDKRKTDLIVSSYTNSGTTYNLNVNSTSRPFSRKFIDPDRIGDATSCNSPIIRYSDILLVYAEASGPTPEAYSAVKRIRNRAGLGDLAPNLSVADFRKAVIKERSYELAFEGNRLFDLRRTNSMNEVLVQQYGKNTMNPQSAYFFPIPLRELQTNPLMTP